MEKRTTEFYTNQPSILRYCLKAGNERDPAILAIALAITCKKNVTLRPEYRDKVYIRGQVGTPSDSNPEIYSGDWIDTTPIESVYFEKAYKGNYVDLHCYVKTKNTTYRLYDSEQNRLTWMHFLLQDIEERDLKFGDFVEYFSDINISYHEVEVVD